MNPYSALEVLPRQGIKFLVYGKSGTGKTSLTKTLEDPLFLNSENGALSISGHDISCLDIRCRDDLAEVYRWLNESEEVKGRYKSVVFDSITDMADIILQERLHQFKDARQAYTSVFTSIKSLINSFQGLGSLNIVMISQLEKAEDETGNILFYPSMPGKSLTKSMPYWFDEVLATVVKRKKIKEDHREVDVCEAESEFLLRCRPDDYWTIKDRSGSLDLWESSDLGQIISKINKVKPNDD